MDALYRASQLMPGMLGADGERNYLILVQNNAEWRSLGGITGVAVLVRTDRGAISLVSAESATSLGRGFTGPLGSIPEEAQAIYETKPTRYFHNLTQIPDFTIDGPLARDMYEAKTGTRVDGVIATDPVTLSYLLSATGPVRLPSGEQLTATNAVQLLLSDVYERYPEPEAQDAFFASATEAVFETLLKGQGSTSSLFSALYRAGEERRTYIWSGISSEQAILDSTTIAGHLPRTDADTARFATFLNDGAGSKMSYYVKPDVSLVWSSCAAQGAGKRQLMLDVRLTSVAPEDAATSLPAYVTGGGAHGVAPGVAKVIGNVYLPEGLRLVSATNSGGTGFSEATFEGRQVLTFGAALAPQSSSHVTVVVEATSSMSEAEALVTPTADASLEPIVLASCPSAAGMAVR